MNQASLKFDKDASHNDALRRHPLTYVFGVIGFLTLLGVGYSFQLLNDPAKFPIRKISVDGDFVHLKTDQVQQLVSGAVDGGFFSLDVEGLRERVMQHPWIRNASVRRIWPDSISVSIQEQQAIANWGDNALLNDQGDIFAPNFSESPSGLVHLEGPLGSENTMLSRYLYLDQQLAVLGIKIHTLKLSDRRAWQVQTQKGKTLIFGRDEIERKMHRFRIAFQDALEQKWSEVSLIDLRYTNGLSVIEQKTSNRTGKNSNG